MTNGISETLVARTRYYNYLVQEYIKEIKRHAEYQELKVRNEKKVQPIEGLRKKVIEDDKRGRYLDFFA